MSSSNYLKQSNIDSTAADALENYFLPMLDFGKIYETIPELLND